MADNYGFNPEPADPYGNPENGAVGQNGYPNKGAAGNGATATNGGMQMQEGAPDPGQAYRDGKPWFYCRWITASPGLAFGLTLFGQFFFLILLILLLAAGVDVIPFVLERLPLDIRDDVDYLRGLAWDERNEDTNVIELFDIGDAKGERLEFIDGLTSMFYIKGGNVLTQENFRLMKEVEDTLTAVEEYRNEFCQLDRRTGDCVAPNSLLRYFDGSKNETDPRFYDPNFENIHGILYLAKNHPDTARDFQYFMGKEHRIELNESYSQITRSTIFLGYPLAGYNSTDDQEEAQEDKVEKFCLDKWQPITDDYYNDKVGKMSYYYSSIYMITAVIIRQVILDQMLALGSLLFIFVFMVIQTQSFWVTCWALFSILTGFATTSLIYRFIFDFRYFGVFHVLAVFIVLGIGADDIFVFFDTWKESAQYEWKSLAHRMSYTYKRAARAMLFTSLTTATAFIVSATSPFLGVSSFGVFSGILILVNYMSVIVFIPTVIVTYHLWWEKYRCCCCCLRPNAHLDHHAAPPAEDKDKRFIVRFFRGPFYKVITQKIFRFVIIIVFIGFAAFFCFYATKLEVQEEQVQLFKENSNFGQVIRLSATAFNKARQTVRVLIAWGLENQDLDDCHFADAKCVGDTVWDDSFNMNSVQAQQDLLGLCQEIRDGLDNETIKLLAIQRDPVENKPEVDCFIESMNTFYTDRDYEVPLTEAGIQTLIDSRPEIYSNDFDVSESGRYFDLAQNYWLMNGFVQDFDNGTQSIKYGEYLGEAPNGEHTKTNNVSLTLPGDQVIYVNYTYDTRLRYMGIIVNLTLDANNLGYPTAKPVRNKWEKFISDRISNMSEGMQGGFQCTPESLLGFNAWHWLKTQEQLVESAILGIGIGIAIAFPILIIATKNLIVGFYATISIILVVASVLAFIPLAGWKLGVLESLNLVLVVGLSVDYVVHLAEGYCRSKKQDRLGRTRDMLEEVGVSVLSGAITTLGASALLLAAQIIFFYQFGIFIFFTILFSILYALILFTTVVALIGPEGDVGTLSCLTACCRKKGSCEISS